MAVEAKQAPSFWQQHWQKFIAGAFWLLLIGGFIVYIFSLGLPLDEALQQTLRQLVAVHTP